MKSTRINNNINYERNKYNLVSDNISNNINLDNLITNTNQIPTYQCCKESIGPLIKIDFCNLEIILKNTSKFYKLFEERGNSLYISDPFPYDETIGLYIRNVIIDDNINYIVPL